MTYPSPHRDPEGFDRFIARLVVRDRIDVVMPVTDVTTHAIARNQDALRIHAAVAVPPFDAFERVTDKASLLQRASKCGIPTPVTHTVDGIAGLKAAQDDIVFPVVVKSTRSRIPTPDGWVGTGIHYVANLDELRRLYRETSYLASYPSLDPAAYRRIGSGCVRPVRSRPHPDRLSACTASRVAPIGWDQRLR
jgi:carbamoylphosphate synthase large subunit